MADDKEKQPPVEDKGEQTNWVDELEDDFEARAEAWETEQAEIRKSLLANDEEPEDKGEEKPPEDAKPEDKQETKAEDEQAKEPDDEKPSAEAKDDKSEESPTGDKFKSDDEVRKSYAEAEKRMHQATQEAADLRRQLENAQAIMRMMQKQGESRQEAPKKQEPEHKPLTPRDIQALLEEDPSGALAFERIQEERQRDAQSINQLREELTGFKQNIAQSVEQQQLIGYFGGLEANFMKEFPDLADPEVMRHVVQPIIQNEVAPFLSTEEGKALFFDNADKIMTALGTEAMARLEALRAKFGGSPGKENGASDDKELSRERVSGPPVLNKSGEPKRKKQEKDEPDTPENAYRETESEYRRLAG